MMNRLFLTILTAFFTFLAFQQTSFAVCVQTGNTPEGGNIINCPAPIQNDSLNPGSDPATTAFADEINVPAGGGINSMMTGGIASIAGNDVIITSGDITGGSNGMTTGSGNDTVIVNGGSVKGLDTNGIETVSGDDTIIVNDGVISAPTEAIFSGSGNDTVILNGGTYISEDDLVIFLVDGNDTLTFGADIDLGGITDCGEDFDTIIFAMDVPEQRLNFFSNQIALATVPDGNVTINGVLYEWENCELLVNELVGVQETRPIPTLSEWGLIAMAGVLGLVGFIAVRRRYKVEA